MSKEYIHWVNTKWSKILENHQKFFKVYTWNILPNWDREYSHEVLFSIENAYKYGWVKIKNAKEFLLHINKNKLEDNLAFQWLVIQFGKFKEEIDKKEWVINVKEVFKERLNTRTDKYVALTVYCHKRKILLNEY